MLPDTTGVRNSRWRPTNRKWLFLILHRGLFAIWTETPLFTFFYCAMLRRREVSWSYRLEFFKNNFTIS